MGRKKPEPPKKRGRPRKKPEGKKPPTEPAVPVNPADIPLLDTEQRFVEEWLVDRNSAAAYRRTFPESSYQTASRRGYEMRHRPNVAAEIAAASAAQRKRTRIYADGLLREIARVATSDVIDLFDPVTNLLRTPRHIPINTRRAIASVKVRRERRTVVNSGETSTTVVDTMMEYKFWPKCEALGKLANVLGLNTTIPPLDALLTMLPPAMAQQIRTAIVAHTSPAIPPSPPVLERWNEQVEQ